jgi:hypothetical protein
MVVLTAWRCGAQWEGSEDGSSWSGQLAMWFLARERRVRTSTQGNRREVAQSLGGEWWHRDSREDDMSMELGGMGTVELDTKESNRGGRGV